MFTRTQILTSLICTAVGVTTVVSVAQVRTVKSKTETGTTVSAPEQGAPAQTAPAKMDNDFPANPKTVMIKMEFVRTQSDGSKEVETENFRGIYGSDISSTSLSTRWSGMLRSTHIVAKQASGLGVVVNLDVDEYQAGTNRGSSSNDRSYSTTYYAKIGETIVLKDYVNRNIDSSKKSSESQATLMLTVSEG